MKDNLTPERVFSEFEHGEGYNRRIELYENVRKNEDFYIGDQWKGVYAPDLEKPVINFIKRTVSYLISMIVSDDVGVSLSTGGRDFDAQFLADTLSGEVENVIEHTKAKTMARDMLRSCAVDGDGCFYFWFEPTGGASGRIRIENIDNTRIIFGNPYCREVEDQPYIIIMRRRPAADLRQEAKAAGCADWEAIAPEGAADFGEDDSDKMATELIRLWKENGSVHFMSTARSCVLRPAADSGLRRYPIAWMSWENVKNSYHGRAAVTGIIPNQIFVNKLWAMAMEHEKRMAFPKIFYDMTKIRQWTNRVGQAIGVAGDPNSAVAASFRAGDMSQQVLQLVEKTISYTKECLGATDVALGNIALDNTSAIIALQNAAAAPLALQKLSFYQFWEDCVLVIMDMIRCYYGVREVFFDTGDEAASATVDFSAIDPDSMELRVDVGPASYWSELVQVETADNLYKNGIITDAVTYLESVPDKYIRNKRRLIDRLEREKATASASAPAAQSNAEGGMRKAE